MLQIFSLTLVTFSMIFASGCRKATLGTIDWQAMDGQRAFVHVEKQVAIGPRPSGSAGSTATQRYITEQLRATGAVVLEQAWEEKTPRGVVKFKNLIAEFRGVNAEILIVGAHYDTKWFAEKLEAEMSVPPFVGANDGGSGVGVLLEVARVLSLKKPTATVWVVFFDGEEAVEHFTETDGLYGSRHFVKELQKSKDFTKVCGAMILDMVGDKDLTVTIPPESSPRMVRAVFDAAATLGVRDRFEYFSRPITDDHTAFLAAGVAAVDVIDFEFGSRHGQNDHWHTPKDGLDKVSAESLQIIGRVALRALDELAWRVASGEKVKH